AGVLEKLEKLNEEQRRAAEIIRNLTSLSRNRQVKAIDSDLRAIVEAALDEVRRHRKKGVAIEVSLGDVPLRLMADPIQLQEAVVASDGGEALRLIERESFVAALLDLKMPKASGMDVLHRLRVARPETAVVVITGQGTIGAAVEAMKAGAIDFVEKPYEVDALRRTLRTVEEERRARILLGGTAAEDAIAWVLSDAATRGVLLAVG